MDDYGSDPPPSELEVGFQPTESGQRNRHGDNHSAEIAENRTQPHSQMLRRSDFAENNSRLDRPYRIIVSETAYLIRKMRKERIIRDGDSPEGDSTESETVNRWAYALNKRLTIDRALTNSLGFGRSLINEKLVKRTWKG